MRVGLPGWSLALDPGWDAEPRLVDLLLSASEEGGELEFSALLRESGAVTAAELRAAAAQPPGPWSEPEAVQYGVFEGLRRSGEEDGLAFRFWVLAQGRLLLRVAYNGLPRCSAAELAQAEAMLQTLRPEAVLGP